MRNVFYFSTQKRPQSARIEFFMKLHNIVIAFTRNKVSVIMIGESILDHGHRLKRKFQSLFANDMFPYLLCKILYCKSGYRKDKGEVRIDDFGIQFVMSIPE